MLYFKLIRIFLGLSVPTKKGGSVVTFTLFGNGQPICKRTNERHDLLLEQLRRNEVELAGFTSYRGRPALIDAHRKTEKGVKGPCILRALSKFDVGRSFLVDSLHNIYLGVFVGLSITFLSNIYDVKFISEATIITLAWSSR